jgi:hypothetical protein
MTRLYPAVRERWLWFRGRDRRGLPTVAHIVDNETSRTVCGQDVSGWASSTFLHAMRPENAHPLHTCKACVEKYWTEEMQHDPTTR